MLLGTSANALKQTKSSQESQYQINGKFYYLKKPWRAKLDLQAIAGKKQLFLNSLLAKEAAFSVKTLEITPVFSLQYRYKRLSIKPEVALPYIQYDFGHNALIYHFSNPSLTFKYAKSSINFFLIRAAINSNPYDPMTFNKNIEIIDGYTIMQNANIPPEDIQKTSSIMLSRFILKPSSGQSVFLSFSLNSTQNPIFINYEIQNNYIYVSNTSANRIRGLQLQVRISQKFFNRKLGANLNLSWNRQNIDAVQKYLTDRKEASIALSPQINTQLSPKIKYTTTLHSSNIGNEGLGLWLDQAFYAQLKYSTSRIQANTDISYHYRFGVDLNTNFVIWNFHIAFRASKKYAVFLSGRDVLNLNARVIQDYRINPNFIEIEQYLRFPGSILIGLKGDLP